MAEGGSAEITLNDINSGGESHSDFIVGSLKKKGRYSTKWYRCSVKLEKDCFVYKREDKATKLICLFDIKLEQDETNDCIFIVTVVNKKNKRLIFKAPSKEECERWMETIFDAIVETKHNNKGKSEACTIQ